VRAQAPPAVTFPRDYPSALVKYAVVDRADGLSRDLYVSGDALEALRRDAHLSEFPLGTLFAIDVYSARQVGRDRKSGTPIFARAEGHLVRAQSERTLHLMQKTQAGSGSRTWTFAGYDPVTTEPLKLELPGDCLLCHQAALVSDLTFSLSLLKRFASTGTVQYGYCHHPGRTACRF
jgi:Cytochrome P460